MFEKRMYQLHNFVNKNVKSNKPCNKFIDTQYTLCRAYDTHGIPGSIVIKIW